MGELRGGGDGGDGGGDGVAAELEKPRVLGGSEAALESRAQVASSSPSRSAPSISVTSSSSSTLSAGGGSDGGGGGGGWLTRSDARLTWYQLLRRALPAD